MAVDKDSHFLRFRRVYERFYKTNDNGFMFYYFNHSLLSSLYDWSWKENGKISRDSQNLWLWLKEGDIYDIKRNWY